MVKVYYFCIFLIIPTLYLSADDNFIPKDFWVTRGKEWEPKIIFDFKGNKITKSDLIKKTIDKGVFKIEYFSNVPFLIIDWQKGNSDKYLMLANENNFMLLYEKDNTEPLYELFYKGKEIPDVVWYGQSLGYPNNITASSTLSENNITYYPNNMCELRINCVWAEGVSGYGINEIITFNGVQAIRFYLSIGYVSYSRPELYMENSRPKRIRVTVDGKSIEVMLKDTPAYQEIDVSSFSSKVTIQILDVYTGTKYEDTCINSIINHFSQ